MSSRLTRIARAIVRRYPPAWRARYEIELVGFIEDSSTGWRDVLDLARGCVVERARAFVEPESHPTRAWMLLGIARFVPALAYFGLLLLLASVLRNTLPPPPSLVLWAALIGLLVLLPIGARAWFKAVKQPFGPVAQLPPRWGIVTWVVLLSASMVLIYWADAPGDPPSRFGWTSTFITAFWYASFMRKAFDLYWPAGLNLSGQLMRIGGLREQLGWARMELQRCESLVEPGGGTLASGAREVVADLEKDLAGAVTGLRHGKAVPPDDDATSNQGPAPARRLQDIAYARQQLEWSRQQRERLEQTGGSAPVPAPPFQVTPPLRLEDVRAELARARDEVQRIEAELREAFASLRSPR